MAITDNAGAGNYFHCACALQRQVKARFSGANPDFVDAGSPSHLLPVQQSEVRLSFEYTNADELAIS